MKKQSIILIYLITIIIFISSLITLINTKKWNCTSLENCMLFENIEYGKHERNLVDIALPKNKKGECGLLLFIHGGGWHAGDKDPYKETLIYWADKGYVAAALNYRYASKTIHVDDILDDITECLYKIKDIGNNNDLEINKVIMQGGSAGAHLSLLYSYSKIDIAPIKPVAVASLSGPTDLNDENYFESMYCEDIEIMFSKLVGFKVEHEYINKAYILLKNASPVNYVNEKSVPTIICQGTNDEIVPYSNGKILDEILTKFNVEHYFVVFENSGHGLENDKKSMDKFNEIFEKYVEKYL